MKLKYALESSRRDLHKHSFAQLLESIIQDWGKKDLAFAQLCNLFFTNVCPKICQRFCELPSLLAVDLPEQGRREDARDDRLGGLDDLDEAHGPGPDRDGA